MSLEVPARRRYRWKSKNDGGVVEKEKVAA